MIHEIVVNKWGYKLFFVESICDDPQIIEQNIMVSVEKMDKVKPISNDLFFSALFAGSESQ